MNRRSERGSAVEIIIIVVLVLVVIGLLAWRVLENNKSVAGTPTTNNNSSNSTSPSQTNEKKTISTQKLTTNYSLTYPANWIATDTVEHNEGDYKAEQISVKSPDGNITAAVDIYENGGQIGGMCDPSEKLVYSKGSQAVLGIQGLYLNVVVVSRDTPKYLPGVGLSKISDPKECEYLNVFSNDHGGNTFGWIESKSPLINKPSMGSDGSFGTLNEYKAFFETADFKTAEQILLSFKEL